MPEDRSFNAEVTITRPANTDAYSALDVVGGAFEIPLIGPAGESIRIISTQLRVNVTAIPSGMTSFAIHLYSVTPPSAIADNGAFDIPAGDRASYLGFVSCGSPADFGASLYSQADNIQKMIKLAAGSTSLFGYLVTAGGFTPADNSEVYVAGLHAIRAA